MIVRLMFQNKFIWFFKIYKIVFNFEIYDNTTVAEYQMKFTYVSGKLPLILVWFFILIFNAFYQNAS